VNIDITDTSSSSNVFTASDVDAAVKEIAKAKGVHLVSDSLAPKHEKFPVCEGTHCKSFDTLTPSLVPENLATTKMSSAFLQMVSKFREAKVTDIQKLLKPKERAL
jgi:hypothetical protein